MTDYGAPTTPGEVLRDEATNLRAKAQWHREQSRAHKEREEALAEAAAGLEHSAMKYDKHQPTLDKGGERA